MKAVLSVAAAICLMASQASAVVILDENLTDSATSQHMHRSLPVVAPEIVDIFAGTTPLPVVNTVTVPVDNGPSIPEPAGLGLMLLSLAGLLLIAGGSGRIKSTNRRIDDSAVQAEIKTTL